MQSMFYRITDFSFARNAKQALGFYLFHGAVAFFGLLFSFIVYALIFGIEANEAVTKTLVHTSITLSVLYVGFLTYKVLEAKERLAQPKYLIWGAFGLLLAGMGLLPGMIVVSCLSVVPPLMVKLPRHGQDAPEINRDEDRNER